MLLLKNTIDPDTLNTVVNDGILVPPTLDTSCVGTIVPSTLDTES